VACSQLPNAAIATRPAPATFLARTLAVALVVAGIVGLAVPTASSAAARRVRTSVALVSQTYWVTGASMSLALAVRSPTPKADLGIKLTVYSRLTSRYAFIQSESGRQTPSELVLDSTPIIPLRALPVSGTSTLEVGVHIRVATSASLKPRGLGSPGLALDCPALDCDGVYPLDVTLVDTSNDTPLHSFTTFLVYVAGEPGSIPLRVALILPFGAAPALDAAGSSTLTAQQTGLLARILASIQNDPDSQLTLEVYPQLLLALAEDPSPRAARVLAELRALAKQQNPAGAVEFLEAPFTPVNLDTLDSAGLGGELHVQLARAAQVFKAVLSAAAPRGVYLSTTPIDDAGLKDLAGEHVVHTVIPDTGLPVISSMSRTSPASLSPSSSGSSASGITAVVADSALATHFAGGVGPALAAHRFLAEVAQIYFEEPFGPQARGVVVAPAAIPNSSVFLSDLFEGLESSPIAQPATVASIFSTVPPGADGSPSHLVAVPDHASPSYQFVSSLKDALATVATIESIAPSDTGLTSRVEDAVLLAETSGLGQQTWSRYAAAPLAAVRQIEHDISIAGTKTITLTQQRANVPITIVSTFPSPIHVILELWSSTLVIAASGYSRPVTLAHKNSPFEIPVTARTSGVSTFTIELVSPRGGLVLFQHVYTVRSTAFSIVAVALSLAALIVLALWWLRSHFRRKFRRTHRAAAEPSPANQG